MLKLMDISLGMGLQSSSRPWDQIEDLLIIADKEDDINVEDLKGCNEDTIMKLIKWLQDEETKGKFMCVG